MAIVRDAAKNVLDFVRRRVLENKDPVLVYTLGGHTNFIWSVAFLDNSEHVVSGSGDGTVRKWRVTDGSEVGKVTHHGSWVYAVAVSGNGKVIASGGKDGKVMFWDSETCEKLVESQENHGDPIWSLSFAADSQTVASGSGDGSVVVWSVRTGERVAGPVYVDRNWVSCVVFSPAGDKIAASGSDRRIRVWDSSLEKKIIPAISVDSLIWSLVWSPDGRQLICGDHKGTVHFLDSSNGALLATCRGHTRAVSSIAVSQGGTFIASASSDRTVRLWSTSTHQQLASLEHPDEVNAIAISRSGRYLASGGDDYKVHVWRLPDFERTLEENKQHSTVSNADPSDSQPTPSSSDPETGSAEHETPAKDPENDGDEPQGLGAPQGHHMTRTASGDSWLDMPAVAPAPAQTVPVGDGMFAEFFGAGDSSTPQPDSRDDRRGKWKKKAKDSRQHLFEQLKNFRNGLLPRDSPSDTNSAPRPSSSQKLKDRISRIRRRSSLLPDNAERLERTSDQQEKNEPKSPKRKSSFVAYGWCEPRIAVASNDPPVQENWYFAKRSRKLVRKPDPSIPDTSQQQGPQQTPSSSTVPSTPSAQGQSSSAASTTASVEGRAQSPASGDSGVEVCGCCGFFILARRG